VTTPQRWLALTIGATLLLTHTRIAAALGDTTVKADPCSIAAGGDARNNTVTCNFGLTPEQLKELTTAAVAGATGPLLDRFQALSSKLGVTREAAKTLLRIVGEQPDLPDEKLAEVLTKVAADYKRLKEQAATLDPDNPAAQALIAHANAAIDTGDLDQAHDLLREATQVQIAAAQEAHKLREQAQSAEYAQMLGAARSTAAEGDVALTERLYEESAALFAQAALYVPPDSPDVTASYLERQAGALYRQGDERDDNCPPTVDSDVATRIATSPARPRAAGMGGDAEQPWCRACYARRT
jgi:tetratricopeptide (TPR) repeat protein